MPAQINLVAGGNASAVVHFGLSANIFITAVAGENRGCQAGRATAATRLALF